MQQDDKLMCFEPINFGNHELFFQIEQDHDKSFRKHDTEDHGNMATFNDTTLPNSATSPSATMSWDCDQI
jgi:hypothetical protein